MPAVNGRFARKLRPFLVCSWIGKANLAGQRWGRASFVVQRDGLLFKVKGPRFWGHWGALGTP